MERHSNYENNNALTEVSLALAMAFFSIMVLSIYALSQSHISQNKKKILTEDILKLINLTENFVSCIEYGIVLF